MMGRVGSHSYSEPCFLGQKELKPMAGHAEVESLMLSRLEFLG